MALPRSSLVAQEDALPLAVGVERLQPQLPAEAASLHAAERRLDEDAPAAVDREDARLHRLGHPHRAAEVARVDRARKAVVALVREANRFRLVVEGDHGGDRAEDLLPC